MTKKRINRRVKYRIKRKPLFISLVLLFISLVLLFSLVSLNKHSNNDIEKHVIREKKKTSITLSFAGDVTMGNDMGSTGSETFDGEFKKQNNDYSYFFKNVKSIFENDDITIVNLEGPLTTSTDGNKKNNLPLKEIRLM